MMWTRQKLRYKPTRKASWQARRLFGNYLTSTMWSGTRGVFGRNVQISATLGSSESFRISAKGHFLDCCYSVPTTRLSCLALNSHPRHPCHQHGTKPVGVRLQLRTF